MVDWRYPPDANHFTTEHENAIASKPGDPPSPQRQSDSKREGEGVLQIQNQGVPSDGKTISGLRSTDREATPSSNGEIGASTI